MAPDLIGDGSLQRSQTSYVYSGEEGMRKERVQEGRAGLQNALFRRL